MLFAVGGAVFSLLGPARLSAITDLINAGINGGSIDLEKIGHIGLILALLYAISFTLTYSQSYLMVSLSMKMGWSMEMYVP